MTSLRRLALPVALFSAASALAGGGPATDAYQGIADGRIDAHAQLDAYFSWDANQPAAGRADLRAYDGTVDRPALGWFLLTLAHRPGRFGFRVDLIGGEAAEVFAADDPARLEAPVVTDLLSHLEQAFVTFVVPVGRGLSLDLGKFASPIGLEDNEASSNWNYSRSFLYTWAEPNVQSGLRATYQPVDQLALSGFWLNGWNANVLGGSGMRSYAIATRWTPAPSVEGVLVYAGGLERPLVPPTQPTLAFRNLLDASVTWFASRWLSLSGGADAGRDASSGGAVFAGVAAYARSAPTEHFAAALRTEVMRDPRGFATGTRQTLGELTATLEGRTEADWGRGLARLEWRHDQSSATVFGRSTGLRALQDTVTLALLLCI